MKITINLYEEELKILQKMADKKLFTLKEQVEDIIRKKCLKVSGKGPKRRIKPLIPRYSKEIRGKRK